MCIRDSFKTECENENVADLETDVDDIPEIVKDAWEKLDVYKRQSTSCYHSKQHGLLSTGALLQHNKA